MLQVGIDQRGLECVEGLDSTGDYALRPLTCELAVP